MRIISFSFGQNLFFVVFFSFDKKKLIMDNVKLKYFSYTIKWKKYLVEAINSADS